MSFDDRIDESRLTVLLDVRHPLAYLALHPAFEFGEQRDIEINWLPFAAPTLREPSSPGPGDDRAIRHRRNRAQMIAREIDTYARAQGLVLRDYYRDADAQAVESAWLWVRERTPSRLFPFLTEVFRAYWAVELDPGDLDAIAKLVASSGGDRAGFEAWAPDEGKARADALRESLQARGVSTVPSYIVEGEYFQGRQHLPMIGWILDGRPGRGPI